jgi:tRNA(Leu) C34 or U34 (ribose-2'-O)-methylase TrmL
MAAPEIGSLNAATSGAVALFEARRQRLKKQGEKGKRAKGERG